MGVRLGFSAGHRQLTLGTAMVLIAVVTMSIQDLVFKRFSSELTLWQIFALRGVLATTVLLVAFSVSKSGPNILRAAVAKWTLVRSALMTIALLSFYAAFPLVSLATSGAALYVAPIIVLILSACLVKEAIRPLGWLGVFVGFAGAIVLLQPGSDAFSAWTLLPLAGAAFYGLSHMVTCTRCQKVPMASMALSLNLIMCVAGLVVSALLILIEPQTALSSAHPFVFGGWSAIDTTDWLWLALLAGFAVIIGMTLAGAYQIASPSVMATFEFSYLIFAVFWDLIFFQIVPTSTSILGMLMIVIAGMMVLQRSPGKSVIRRVDVSATV